MIILYWFFINWNKSQIYFKNFINEKNKDENCHTKYNILYNSKQSIYIRTKVEEDVNDSTKYTYVYILDQYH